MPRSGTCRRGRSLSLRLFSQLVVIGCLASSPLSVWLAWGVLYPEVKQLASSDTFDAIVVLAGEDRRIDLGLDLADNGRAPVVVFSYGEKGLAIRDRCGTNKHYAILCPEPPEDSTRGEAQMIRDLVDTYEWESIVIVTGDYHVARVRVLVDRCVEDSVRVVLKAVDWGRPSGSLVRSEVLKTAYSRWPFLGC